MADNLTVRTDDGTNTVATDEIAGVHYTRMKVVLGADGNNDGDISRENPVPVLDASNPNLNYYVLVGEGGTSTVTIEILNKSGVVVYKGSLAVSTTAKSFDNWLTSATPVSAFVSSMSGVRIYSVTGNALLLNTGGNGAIAITNGVTSGMAPATGAASRIPVGSYVSQNVGFGRGF
jgi:hypothetical protein